MERGDFMPDTFENLLSIAANYNFRQEISSDAVNLNADALKVDLNRAQLEALHDKILLLPSQGIFLLFSKYCFQLTPSEAEFFYGSENAEGHLRYYRKLLSSVMGLQENEIISDGAMEKACKTALNDYLDQEGDQGKGPAISFFPAFGPPIKKLARRIAVAAIVAVMSFSTMMAANAQFRKAVVSWLVETFEKYSIFELKSGDAQTIQALQKYTPHYLPAGFELKNTIAQPSLILYEYRNLDDEALTILMSLSDTRIYVDTEGIKLENPEIEGVSAYYFEKDAVGHLAFERDGCYFMVYGSVGKEELIKIAVDINPE